MRVGRERVQRADNGDIDWWLAYDARCTINGAAAASRARADVGGGGGDGVTNRCGNVNVQLIGGERVTRTGPI